MVYAQVGHPFRTFFQCVFEKVQRVLPMPQAGMDDGEMIGRDIDLLFSLGQFLQDLFCFG